MVYELNGKMVSPVSLGDAPMERLDRPVGMLLILLTCSGIVANSPFAFAGMVTFGAFWIVQWFIGKPRVEVDIKRRTVEKIWWLLGVWEIREERSFDDALSVSRIPNGYRIHWKLRLSRMEYWDVYGDAALLLVHLGVQFQGQRPIASAAVCYAGLLILGLIIASTPFLLWS